MREGDGQIGVFGELRLDRVEVPAGQVRGPYQLALGEIERSGRAEPDLGDVFPFDSRRLNRLFDGFRHAVSRAVGASFDVRGDRAIVQLFACVVENTDLDVCTAKIDPDKILIDDGLSHSRNSVKNMLRARRQKSAPPLIASGSRRPRLADRNNGSTGRRKIYPQPSIALLYTNLFVKC